MNEQSYACPHDQTWQIPEHFLQSTQDRREERTYKQVDDLIVEKLQFLCGREFCFPVNPTADKR